MEPQSILDYTDGGYGNPNLIDDSSVVLSNIASRAVSRGTGRFIDRGSFRGSKRGYDRASSRGTSGSTNRGYGRANGRGYDRAHSRGSTRGRASKRWPRYNQSEEWEPPTYAPGVAGVKVDLEKYIRDRPQGTASWLHDPDVPTSREIGTLLDGRVQDQVIDIFPNKIEGAWESKEAYLKSHHTLMRLDAITPLRNAVDEVRATPSLIEQKSRENARIYENVYIIGLTVARQGLALRIEFSTRRAEKKILWSQSRRLKTGTIVALTPVEDKFKTKCLVAVVAARALLDLNIEAPGKPSIHVFVGDPSSIEIDPQQEWIMVEASTGYWEASRHTLQALQKLHDESFPLIEHIVKLQDGILAPQYRQSQPFMDLSTVSTQPGNTSFEVDILQDWPSLDHNVETHSLLDSPAPPFLSEFDATQLNALQRILTKRLAIIQGPPGTGKSHISIVALRMLLRHASPDDPPIIVTAHTNHAVDQLLRHISEFEPDFIRLGGQTTDFDIIKPRTLFEVRRKENARMNATTLQVREARKTTVEQLTTVLEPLTSNSPITPEVFLEYGLITQAQYHSLQGVESELVGFTGPASDTIMGIYCEDTLVPAEKKKGLLLYDNTYEEFDETEKLQEEELEMMAELDDEFENLRGKQYALRAGFTTHQRAFLPDDEIRTILRSTEDLTQVPYKNRGEIYKYLQRMLKIKVTQRVREIGKTCQTQAREFQIGRWESDVPVLNKARIIGMTTTGLSKNRGLLCGLKPKIVLIEEAAETIEAYTAAACLPSLEHLILVGDHQQLRGHCATADFEGEPCYLDVSMFERLVRNNVEYTQLLLQRRMRPEFRQIIQPIYPALADHPSVIDRPDIPGMGGVNCHFFHHHYGESNDDAFSKKNEQEAHLVVSFYEYLVSNQLDMNHITILTFYNGQKKLILSLLRRNPAFMGVRVRVATVDAYQGEENEVILLSLVRNNSKAQIGFLGVLNRVCVALSRARRGFYLFGNSGLLAGNDDKWRQILRIMVHHGQVERFLPITCENHGERKEVTTYHDFMDRSGGCEEPCDGILPCGHGCPLKCHVLPHDSIRCMEVCPNFVACGHQCDQLCWKKPCACDVCEAVASKRIKGKRPPTDHDWMPCNAPSSAANQEAVQKWTKFADGAEDRKREADRAWEARRAEVEKAKVEAEKEMRKLKVAEVENNVEAEKKMGKLKMTEVEKDVETEKEEEPLIQLDDEPASSSKGKGKGKRRVWKPIDIL